MGFLLVLACEKILQSVLLSPARPRHVGDAQEMKHMLSGGAVITCNFGVIYSKEKVPVPMMFPMEKRRGGCQEPSFLN